jgi:uncharacterized protein (DUF1501 family)
MMVLGGQVQGGRFHGGWPGLTPDKLDEGVDLAVVTDYRQVLIEVLGCGTKKPVAGIFPGYAYPGELGIFGA